MGDQNMAPHESQDSIFEAMNHFKFDDGNIERVITFDNSSDTDNDEPYLKSEPLSPKTAEKTIHKTDYTLTTSNCGAIDSKIIINKDIKSENIASNDTGQIQNAKGNFQITNQTSSNTNAVQSFHSLLCSPPRMSETLENTEIDTSKRKYDDPDLQECGTKIQKTHFPRTKITSRRLLKKFPGKMDSMKNMQQVSEPILPEPVRESLVNNDDTSKRKNDDPDLQECGTKIQKTHFPRTKMTSRRLVKKFPGKMDSMKNMQQVSEPILPEPVRESLVNNDYNRLSIDSGRRTPESEQRIMVALKMVAENLIHISPYLYRFVKTSRLNVTEYKIASDAFKNAKYHYFALSYSTVASTILPYTKDPKFMQNFYDLTFLLAEQKRIPNTFSEKSLQILCSEMIDWTQMKISQNRNDEINQLSAINNTPSTKSSQLQALETATSSLSNNEYTMNNNLNRNVSCKTTSLPSEATNNNGDITLVFPAENINSAIKISYNPVLTSQLSIPSQSCTNVNSNITVQNNYSGQPNTQQQHNSPQCVQYQQQSPALLRLLQRQENCNNQQEVQHCLQPLAMPANVLTQNPLSNIKIQNCYQVPPSPQKKTFSGHYSQTYTSTPSQKALNFVQQHNQNDQLETNQRNCLRLGSYPQERSTSRDSGFFSPVQDNYLQDCLISSPSGIATSPPGLPAPPPYPCNPYQQPPIESPANTKTLPIPLHSCIVCKRLTNLACLGCQNTYYCGETCHNLDWRYHSKYCRRNT